MNDENQHTENSTRLSPETDVTKYDVKLSAYAEEPMIRRIDVECKINCNSQLILEYSHALYMTLELIEETRTQREPQVSAEELARYIGTLVHSRVNHVRRSAGLAFEHFVVRPTTQDILVPEFVSSMLSHIGIVEVPEEGVHFTPVINKDNWKVIDGKAVAESSESNGFEPYDISQMKDISNKLYKYRNLGVELNYGYSRRLEGNADFMMVTVVSNEVSSAFRNVPWARTFAAAFFELNGVEIISRPRFEYGTLDRYRFAVRDMAQPRVLPYSGQR